MCMSLFFSLSPAVLSFLPNSPKSKPWLLILTPLQSYMDFLLSSPLIPINASLEYQGFYTLIYVFNKHQ